MKQYTKPRKIINTLRPGLCGDDPLATVKLPQRSLSSQSLGKYWQLNQNNQETEYIKRIIQKLALISNNTMKKLY